VLNSEERAARVLNAEAAELHRLNHEQDVASERVKELNLLDQAASVQGAYHFGKHKHHHHHHNHDGSPEQGQHGAAGISLAHHDAQAAAAAEKARWAALSEAEQEAELSADGRFFEARKLLQQDPESAALADALDAERRQPNLRAAGEDELKAEIAHEHSEEDRESRSLFGHHDDGAHHAAKLAGTTDDINRTGGGGGHMKNKTAAVAQLAEAHGAQHLPGSSVAELPIGHLPIAHHEPAMSNLHGVDASVAHVEHAGSIQEE